MLKKIKKWYEENKDAIFAGGEGFLEGYVIASAVVYTIMILKALITHKKWDLVDPKK